MPRPSLLKGQTELAGHKIFTTKAELYDFFENGLSCTKYSHIDLKKDFGRRFTRWMNASPDKENIVMFYAVEDEPDNFAKNDDWGHHTLYECIAVKLKGGKIHVLKKEIEQFPH
jgi:hypothetical protein